MNLISSVDSTITPPPVADLFPLRLSWTSMLKTRYLQSSLLNDWLMRPTWQITRIKERVEEQSGVPPQQQRLIFGGRQLYVHLLY